MLAEVGKLTKGKSPSWSTLIKLRAEEPVDHYIVSRVANALGTTPESLLLVEVGIIKVANGDFRTWKPGDWVDLQQKLMAAGLPPGKVELREIGEGCVKLTVEMTAEQREVLERLFAEGKLAPLGISDFATRPRGRWDKTRAIAYAATGLLIDRLVGTAKWPSLAASAAGIVCAAYSLLPVARPTLLAAGCALSLFGIAIGYRRHYLILLGVAGLAINLISWRMHILDERDVREAARLKAEDEEIDRQVAEEMKLRSTVIVLFPLTATEVDKYDFEGPWDEERIKVLKKKYVGIGSREAAAITIDGVKEMLGLMGGPKLTEIPPRSEEEQRLKELQALILAKADDFVMLAPGFMTHGYDPGRQTFDLTTKKKSIYAGDVYIPKSSNIYCVLKRYPNGEVVLDHFIPDITKPPQAP